MTCESIDIIILLLELLILLYLIIESSYGILGRAFGPVIHRM